MARDPHLDQFLKVFQRAAEIAAQAMPHAGAAANAIPQLRGHKGTTVGSFGGFMSQGVWQAFTSNGPVPIGDPPERMKEAEVLSVRTEPIDPDEP